MAGTERTGPGTSIDFTVTSVLTLLLLMSLPVTKPVCCGSPWYIHQLDGCAIVSLLRMRSAEESPTEIGRARRVVALHATVAPGAERVALRLQIRFQRGVRDVIQRKGMAAVLLLRGVDAGRQGQPERD